MGRDAVGAPALASGAAIAWSNAVLPRLTRRFGLGPGTRGAATLAFCAADAALARGRLPAGLGVAGGGALAVAGLAAAQPVRREEHAPSDLARWVLLEIPLGTALPEELLFRGGLTPGLRTALGPLRGAAAGALVFGMWHVSAAKSARQPIFPTIAVTSFAGACFDELTHRTRRLWPATLAHWALNSAGAILTLH